MAKHEGDLTITETAQLGGMVTGSIFVTAGGDLVLQGMCCKDLVVEKGATATIRGMVVGTVINRGGRVEIFGMVGGVSNVGTTETVVHPKAVVGT